MYTTNDCLVVHDSLTEHEECGVVGGDAVLADECLAPGGDQQSAHLQAHVVPLQPQGQPAVLSVQISGVSYTMDQVCSGITAPLIM